MFKPDSEQRKFTRAMGNASRLEILIALWKAKKELNVYKMHQHTGLGRSAINRHLKVLMEAGLVLRKTYGEIVFYTINCEDRKTCALIQLFEKSKL